MKTIQRFLAKPHACTYLADRRAQMEYEFIEEISRSEYGQRLNEGWRKMGGALFRPQCGTCKACQSIRILVDKFEPNRNQRRVAKANANTLLRVEYPSLTKEKCSLYLKHHQHHHVQKGWPKPSMLTVPFSISHFIQGPLTVQEWQYYHDEQLIAIAYIDEVDWGLSGVYFYFAPDARELSPGTYIILSMIERAKTLHLPYVYLGYYVRNCQSMEYKGRFFPSEVLSEDGTMWIPFEKSE